MYQGTPVCMCLRNQFIHFFSTQFMSIYYVPRTADTMDKADIVSAFKMLTV